MTLSLAVPDFLMLALALQGFVLSGLLFYSAGKIKSNRWISLLIFCISAEAVWPIIEAVSLKHSFSFIYYLFIPVNMALGPLIYFYTRSLLFSDAGLPRRKYIYFLPMLIDMKHQLIFLLYTTGILAITPIQEFYFRPAIQNLLFSFSNRFIILSMLSMVIYIIISYRLIIKSTIDQTASAVKLADIKWLKKFLLFLFGLLVLWITAVILGNFFRISWQYYLLFIPAIVFIHWLGFKAYFRQGVMAPADIAVYNKPAAKVYFTNHEAAGYIGQLNNIMSAEKLYLDPLLKLEDLADKLSLPEKQVSNLINQHMGKNFNDFVNGFRVDEAMKQLADPALSHFTIAAIAFDCGFNSLPTFQRCFKQFTGLTPSQYQNHLKLNIAGAK